MFDKVLIANRGAIAVRIMRTLRALSLQSVAVYTGADAASLHVDAADQAIRIGEGPASESYLDGNRIIQVALETGAQAIHPGYGFLSENADFAQACDDAGIAFLGPSPQQMRDFGLKHMARKLAEENGLPMLPGSGLLEDVAEAQRAADKVGFPVMLKSTAGGGGIGMRLCQNAQELKDAFAAVQGLGKRNFGDAGVFLEKYITRARHLEVQLFGDGKGGVISLGERDCSLQRRNQKVVEETPAPNISQALRRQLCSAGEKLGAGVQYRSAGTVEFVFDVDAQAFYFLEMNTRLQVEHGVTEAVTGVDIVAWMIKLAAGELEDLESLRPEFSGHAIQARVYAEDPGKDFQPATGTVTAVNWPSPLAGNSRCDTWVAAGAEVSPYYDPLLAKLIVHAHSREAALEKLQQALKASSIAGLETNLDYLAQVVADPVFVAGEQTTRYLQGLQYQRASIEVISPGTLTTVQDYPGRVGHWDVGVPPSGPMDTLAFRLGNRLLGNPEEAAGLEFTASGATLRFTCDAVCALTGADMGAALDGKNLIPWQSFAISAGQTLSLGAVLNAGVRAYLCVQGGLDVPEHMGSRSTFTLGQFGGHGGRALRAGDVLRISPASKEHQTTKLPTQSVPVYPDTWELRVIYGPHAAPDFFTRNDIEKFFATEWEVHFQSSRTGVRLIGPKPEWAREDGGEAGLHPSNIHDNAYAIGAIDFTGDMPVILGPDGPSLGGFVCPAVVIRADRWKLGQLAAGDKLRFLPVSQENANALAQDQEALLSDLKPQPRKITASAPDQTILLRIDESEHPVGVCYRPSGDDYLLIEYGENRLDIALRFRVHALMLRLQDQAVDGILELTPGVRSLQVHYASERLKLTKLLDILQAAEAALAGMEDQALPSRIVHLPLSWDDPATREAITRYDRSVRKNAPWFPSNIEFIRRINGLENEDQVKQIVYGANYLVMGLGDVYLGAPLATPIDPRHRLVTTKCNPARTWTPENAVGIGGAYMCIYGMEGPGGYQFVGRTLQVWNRYRETEAFTQPHLLRFFDQIRFFPVPEDELLRIREDFPRGRYEIKTESTKFSLSEHQRFLDANQAEIIAFKNKQQTAFEAERQRWANSGEDITQAPEPPPADDAPLADGEFGLDSQVHGSLLEYRVAEGDAVAAGDTVAVLESMKMEISVAADRDGVVQRLASEPGALITSGQRLLVLKDKE